MFHIDESGNDQFKRLEQVLIREPNNVEALIDIGILLFEHFYRHDEALDYFHRALKCDPKNVEALFWLAACHYFDFLECEEAQQFLEKALKLDSTRPECYSLMASIMSEKEDLKQATFYTRKALSLAPDWPNLYRKLASLLLEQGEVGESEEIAKKGIIFCKALSNFPNEKQRYFEWVITGRAIPIDDEGWVYLFNSIKEAKQQCK